MNQNNLIQTGRFVLSETERSSTEHEVHHYEDPRVVSIEALKIVQKRRGWVPGGAIPAIGEVLGIPASDVGGIATFYNQIFHQPVGRHIIRVCDSMVCYTGGHEPAVGGIQKRLDIDLGQTTADGRFVLFPVCCLGNCNKAPALMVDDDTRGDVHPDSIARLLEAYVWPSLPLVRPTA